MPKTMWRWILPVVVLLAGCAKPPPPPLPPPAPLSGDFSSEQAWAHLQALTGIGPRVAGTDGSERARDYIRAQLETLEGVEIETYPISLERGEDLPKLQVESLSATIEGESADLVILAAPFDSAQFETFDFVGANDGASGAAVLLEIARVLANRPLPYTTILFFLDGEAPLPSDDPNTQRGLLSSTAIASKLASQGVMRHVRLVVVLNKVGDADLRIARDLRSHRIYREEFFKAARRLGYEEAFQRNAPFESPTASHLPFLSYNARRVVAIVDTRYGGDEAPGIYADTEDDTIERCSPQSLEAVGVVTLAAVSTITKRLAKVDRFADGPTRAEVTPLDALAAGEEADASPEGSAVAEDETQASPGAEPQAPATSPAQASEPAPATPPAESPETGTAEPSEASGSAPATPTGDGAGAGVAPSATEAPAPDAQAAGSSGDAAEPAAQSGAEPAATDRESRDRTEGDPSARRRPHWSRWPD